MYAQLVKYELKGGQMKENSKDSRSTGSWFTLRPLRECVYVFAFSKCAISWLIKPEVVSLKSVDTTERERERETKKKNEEEEAGEQEMVRTRFGRNQWRHLCQVAKSLAAAAFGLKVTSGHWHGTVQCPRVANCHPFNPWTLIYWWFDCNWIKNSQVASTKVHRDNCQVEWVAF